MWVRVSVGLSATLGIQASGRFMGYSLGHPPPGINGAGPTVGPPASSRSGFGWGLGERVGSGVGDGLAVAGALAVGKAPAGGDAQPSDEPAAPAQLSTVTVYGRSGPSPYSCR